jgi:hypothetical protein
LRLKRASLCAVARAIRIRKLCGAIQHFLLIFRGDQLLDVLHNLVPPGHQCFDFILGEITLDAHRHFVPVQCFQLFEWLAVATGQVIGVLQLFVEAEGAAEINPPDPSGGIGLLWARLMEREMRGVVGSTSAA